MVFVKQTVKKTCHFDNGDCNQFCFTLTNCTYEKFTNFECDEECNNEYCRWDAEYCNTTATAPTSRSSTPRSKGSNER